MEIKTSSGIRPELWEGLRSPSPFQTSWYLRIFSSRFASRVHMVEIWDKGALQALLPFEKQEDNLIILGMKQVLGGQEVSDYTDVIAPEQNAAFYDEIFKQVFASFKAEGIRRVCFEYVRADSKIYHPLRTFSHIEATREVVAPYITLPPTWEDYLAILDRVDRKELKRKLNRLKSVPHEFSIIDSTDETAFAEFIRLHRLSDTDKNKFMSAEMEQFFHDLCQREKHEWKSWFAVLKINNTSAASILFFEQDERVLLYNSGYDPGLKYYSSGLMAHALLIRRNIEAGKKIHDFLRGNERYKYDLGAKDINLYKISIDL